MEVLELRSTITEMKNSLKELNSKSGLSEKTINKLEDRLIEIIQKKNGKRMKKNEQGFRPIGHHQVYQYAPNRSPRRRRENSGNREYLKKY